MPFVYTVTAFSGPKNAKIWNHPPEWKSWIRSAVAFPSKRPKTQNSGQISSRCVRVYVTYMRQYRETNGSMRFPCVGPSSCSSSSNKLARGIPANVQNLYIYYYWTEEDLQPPLSNSGCTGSLQASQTAMDETWENVYLAAWHAYPHRIPHTFASSYARRFPPENARLNVE